MLAARIRQINNLMAATCAGCDDLCHWGLLVDVVDQMRRMPNNLARLHGHAEPMETV